MNRIDWDWAILAMLWGWLFVFWGNWWALLGALACGVAVATLEPWHDL